MEFPISQLSSRTTTRGGIPSEPSGGRWARTFSFVAVVEVTSQSPRRPRWFEARFQTEQLLEQAPFVHQNRASALLCGLFRRTDSGILMKDCRRSTVKARFMRDRAQLMLNTLTRGKPMHYLALPIRSRQRQPWIYCTGLVHLGRRKTGNTTDAPGFLTPHTASTAAESTPASPPQPRKLHPYTAHSSPAPDHAAY